MDLKYRILPAICLIAVLVAGCTSGPQAPVASPPATTPPVSPATPEMTPAAGCTNDTCSLVQSSASQGPVRSLRIEASPRRYSPMMSSTPGIGLAPDATGFNTTTATFSWNASYGEFLSWNAPDYTVHTLGSATSNTGGKLYWSFTDRPASTTEPVVITVTARDRASGTVLGTSTVTLAWDGDDAVTVKEP